MINFLLGLLSGVILLLIGQGITRIGKERDKRAEIIQDVAEKYQTLARSGRTNGMHGLLEAGVTRLRNLTEILATAKQIEEYGLHDPLKRMRKDLDQKDFHRFFRILRENNLNPINTDHYNKAVGLTATESVKSDSTIRRVR